MIDRTSAFCALVVGVVAGTSMAVALGCATARASAGSCEEDEHVSLDDPVVTVIDGPGDAAAEQARWPDGDAYWHGDLFIPPVIVSLERVEQ